MELHIYEQTQSRVVPIFLMKSPGPKLLKKDLRWWDGDGVDDKK